MGVNPLTRPARAGRVEEARPAWLRAAKVPVVRRVDRPDPEVETGVAGLQEAQADQEKATDSKAGSK